MKIGITTDIVDSTKYHKGVSYYIQYLVKNLPRMSNDEIYLVHFKHSNNYIYKLDLGEIIIRSSDSGFSKSLASYRRKELLKELDIIHTTAPRLPYFPLYSIPKVKKVLTVHGLDLYIPSYWRARFHKMPMGWLQQKLLDVLFSRNKDKIDAFIAVSNFLKQELVTYLRIPNEKICVVYHGVDTRFKPLKIEKYPVIISDTPLPELIEIYYKLRKKGITHKLLIFTRRGYGAEAEKLVYHLNLQKYVDFIGHLPQDELIGLYNRAEVFVHLAGYEGFGLTTLEAMACGCPVVTTNVGSLPEVVGDAGILKNQEDIEGLVNAIYEVLTNDGLRQDMIKRGLERAKMFSWEKTARETIKVYEDVCK